MRQELRDYQRRGLSEILAAFRSGARSVLAVSPTGSGKTTLFGSLVSDIAAGHQRSVILVHRRELATQASNRLREFGTPYGLIMAGETPRSGPLVQIASVQTLVRRRAPEASLVVCDEAHLSTAKTWQTILDNYPRARILGVTATPWRLGGKPLVGAYDRCVVVATPTDLREQGHLCDYVGFSYLAPDLSSVSSVGGEYNEQQAAEAMSAGVIVDNVVEEWLKHARELSTVVFAVTVEHSQALCAKFRAAGVTAEHIDGGTPKAQRDAVLRRVEQGRTMVLCNVGIAVEGLDIPRLKCCVLARPTKSLARAIQMMGRVRRPWNGVTARIHDHAFNIRLHGLPDAERDYTLSAKPEKPPSLTTCQVCLAMYSGKSCPGCGVESESKPVIERVINVVTEAEQFTFTSNTDAGVSRPPVDVRWDTPGRVIEGRFRKTWTEDTQYGPRKRYLISGAKREYNIPGTAHLDALMSRVVQIPDSVVRITYLDDQPLPGGKHRKVFKLEVAE